MLPTGQNIYLLDKYIRYILTIVASIFLVINIEFHIINILLLIIILFTYFTANNEFCPIYYLLNINTYNRKLSLLQTKLPKNNPDSVFIFDIEGKVVYKNITAKNIFPNINKYSDLNGIDILKIINNNESNSIIYNYQDKIYQVDSVGSNKDKSLFVYTTDITESLKLKEEINASQREMIYTFGQIGETRSKETGYHVKRVALYSELLGKLYNLNKSETDLLKDASPMHDIGKVGIPDKILNKPGKLNEDEFEIMKTHAELGYKILNNSERPIFKMSSIIAYQHHEKYDGSGYPRGLKGESIHIYARITAIADVFDALGSDRIYKKSWELERILDFFKKERAKHFDPDLIDLFFENLDMFLEIRDQYKNKASA